MTATDIPSLAGAEETGPETLIVDRFRAQVAASAGMPAVTFTGGSYTYAEIDRWSDAVAHDLVAAGAPVDRPVAVLARSNVPLVPAAVAVVKAGHFYITVDITDPDERIALLLRQANAGLCLVEAGLPVPKAATALPVVSIGSLPESAPPLPPREPNPYVNLVFTSGTTGKPKGIMTRQRGFVASMLARGSQLDSAPGERVMFRSLPGFTRANHILGALLVGSTLCAFDARNESLSALAEYIKRERLTMISLTPAIFRRLMRALPPELDLSHVRKLRCGADIVTVADVELFKKHFPRGCTWIIGYASSETGGGVCRFGITHDTPVPGPLVPMGRPRNGVELRIVDEEGNDVPDGNPGELIVTSSEVAEGYWNEPELTAERFVFHPDRPGVRTFKTGDLVMRDAEGLYYFVGRKDFRLRIHNRRIDPLQVESAIVRLTGIEAAVVVGKPDEFGEKHMVAYVVTSDGGPCDRRALRAALRRELPGWMVPSRIYEIDRVPVTPGMGKVDRNALTERVDPPPPGEESDAADDVEQRLIDLWERVLDMRVRVSDDFFDDLGGESVVAAHLVTEVQKETGSKMPVSMLLELNTVRKMAAYLRAAESADRLAVLVQAGGPLPPIFCVTGRDGIVLKFRHLAAALGNSRPFYGLTFHGFDRSRFPQTVSTMVACYAESVRRIQPHGPYFLAGYSGGARIALELARHLERHGERTAFVGLLDAGADQKRPSIWKRIANRIDMLRQLPEGRVKAFVREAATRPFAIVRRQVRASQVQRGIAFPEEVRAANRANASALRDYSPEPYAGDVTLFRARNGQGMLGTEPDHGWSRSGVQRLRIVDVAGDHNTLLTDEVASLAAAFRAEVEAASGRNG